MLPKIIRQQLANSGLRRIFKNISWLLGARIVTGASGLLYLSIVTHRLGAQQYGILVLIQTYVLLITTLTTFQSWQAVIRYGAICLEKQDKAALQQLIKFTTLLDVLGVFLGLALAILIAPLMGNLLGWAPNLITQLQWCSLSIIFTVVATPTGLLRLYDRFDLLAVHLTVLPVVQLLGTVVIALLHLPLWGYLLAWFIANVAEGAFLIGFGWHEAGKRGLISGMTGSLTNLTQAHPGLWKFCLMSNFDSSLPMVMRQVSPLLIGIFGTATGVGHYRIAYELSTPLKDIALLFTQSIYPELAQLNSQQRWRTFTALVLKTSKISLGVGLITYLVVIFTGKIVLFYGFGTEFVAAYSVLLLLVGAEVFTMGSCSLEPALYALGRPSLCLRVNAIAIIGIYIPSLIILTQHFGSLGAGIATLLSTATIFILNSVLTWQQLARYSKIATVKNSNN
ncbi:MAG: oligosaccharide flippase family protein [Cyanobacteria bacterium J06634_5]